MAPSKGGLPPGDRFPAAVCAVPGIVQTDVVMKRPEGHIKGIKFVALEPDIPPNTHTHTHTHTPALFLCERKKAKYMMWSVV